MPLDLAADALAMLDDFGEEVVYLPRDGPEAEIGRTIRAVVERGDAMGLGVGGIDARTPSIRVTAANDARDGIAASELDTGGDRVRVAVRVGGTPQDLEIARLAYHDEGAVVVELR